MSAAAPVATITAAAVAAAAAATAAALNRPTDPSRPEVPSTPAALPDLEEEEALKERAAASLEAHQHEGRIAQASLLRLAVGAPATPAPAKTIPWWKDDVCLEMVVDVASASVEDGERFKNATGVDVDSFTSEYWLNLDSPDAVASSFEQAVKDGASGTPLFVFSAYKSTLEKAGVFLCH